MKKIVVTGGSGRLGQHVIRELLSHDYLALSLDRISPAEKVCPAWVVDLCSSGNLFEALKEAYGIVHLGAYQAPGLVSDSETFSNNVTATYNVLKASLEAAGFLRIIQSRGRANRGFVR